MSSVVENIVMGGMGKVGHAITQVLAEAGRPVMSWDKEVVPDVGKCEFLHVAIPYSREFIREVKKGMMRYKPNIVIVHSTVPVGTTRKFGRKAVHSPVRGQHNNLNGAMRDIVKYVGGVVMEKAEKVKSLLALCSVPVEVWKKPEDTELMKLLCLSRFLNDLAFYEEADKICKRFRVDETKMNGWTRDYNVYYKMLEMSRPVLNFPRGNVGGSCVIPVSKMLQAQTKSSFFRKNIDRFKKQM